MKTSIEKVWGQIYSEQGLPQDNTYVVAFGNSEWGERFTSQEAFKKAYRELLYRAHSQDMYVYYNGKPLRIIRNYAAKITGSLMVVGLGPSEIVKAEYIKYLI